VACAVAVVSLAIGCRAPPAPRTEAPRDAGVPDTNPSSTSAAARDEPGVVRGVGTNDRASAPVVGGGAARGRASPPADADGPPAAFRCLAGHYAGRAVKTGATWSLELPDGTTVPYDDGRAKKTAERIASPDVEDIFAIGYRTGAIAPVTDAEQDPGRVRLEPLFRATYGANEREVSAALTTVRFAGKAVRFHRRAAPALERVARRIDELRRADPTLGRFFEELGGTYATRAIAGTDRTSAHAWGIALDIDTSKADYWRNTPKGGWRNRIPQAIVDAFEAEGFVWGGRWFHYDTMHFEYRPELTDPRCRPER
jgi:D-alanyl-D-alanine carboxypeptidase